MKKFTTILALGAIATLAACNSDRGDETDDITDPIDAVDTTLPDPDSPVSIIRSDVEQPDQPDAQPEPFTATVGFPDGGSALDDAATSVLAGVLEAKQTIDGGLIALRAHSDAGGSDAANMRASQARGDAVKAWLVKNGIAEDRINVIAFGEQNPVEPNALPDGSPNEAGRAANRRIDIEVMPVKPPVTLATPEPKS